jgi:hypothetical protein
MEHLGIGPPPPSQPTHIFTDEGTLASWEPNVNYLAPTDIPVFYGDLQPRSPYADTPSINPSLEITQFSDTSLVSPCKHPLIQSNQFVPTDPQNGLTASTAFPGLLDLSNDDLSQIIASVNDGLMVEQPSVAMTIDDNANMCENVTNLLWNTEANPQENQEQPQATPRRYLPFYTVVDHHLELADNSSKSLREIISMVTVENRDAHGAVK